MPRESVQTARPCPRCGESPAGRPQCLLCDGSGVVSAEVAKQEMINRDQKLTGKLSVWHEVLKGFLVILEQKNTPSAQHLKKRGEDLLTDYEQVVNLPQGHEDRLKVCNKMIEYQRMVVNYLGGSR